MRARGWSARRLRWEDVLKKLFARFHLLHDVLRADRRALPVLRVPQQTGAAAHRVAQPEHVKDERPESVGLRAESVGCTVCACGCSLDAWGCSLQRMGLQRGGRAHQLTSAMRAESRSSPSRAESRSSLLLAMSSSMACSCDHQTKKPPTAEKTAMSAVCGTTSRASTVYMNH